MSRVVRIETTHVEWYRVPSDYDGDLGEVKWIAEQGIGEGEGPGYGWEKINEFGSWFEEDWNYEATAFDVCDKHNREKNMVPSGQVRCAPEDLICGSCWYEQIRPTDEARQSAVLRTRAERAPKASDSGSRGPECAR